MTQSLQVSSAEAAGKFSKRMKEIAVKEKEQKAQSQAATFGVPYINLFRFPITPDAVSLISKEESLRWQVVCFLFTGAEIRLGAVNPQDPAVTEIKHILEERHHSHGVIYLISEHSFNEAVKFYEFLPVLKPRSKDVAITQADLDRFSQIIGSLTEMKRQFQTVQNVSDLLVMIIASALKFVASDAHLESEENKIVVRFRLDGILQEIGELPKEVWSKVVSRIKLLSGLKINITDKPQDGRFTIASVNQKIDVRVSTLPTVFGESVVMRILKPLDALTFDQLGLRDQVLDALKKQVEKPTGMIITTGPTGSGKTTTLYAILQKINKPDIKIITLEDPVEYKLEGVNQSQIDVSRDYTFARGLRSMLRQDPDVVMVGEIRDLETAEVAIQAALTGHFMLSTIHTNSAAGAIPRFLSMGVKPFLLAPALNAVMGQRLVRRLCQECKKKIDLDKEKLDKAKAILQKLPPDFLAQRGIDLGDLQFYGSRGCSACNDLGYKGRIGIYELMEMNKEIEQLILKGEVSNYIIEEVAVKSGLITMAQDGLLKSLEGITSVEEVFRVVE